MIYNPKLREHVTSSAFRLDLTRNHVAVLVWLHANADVARPGPLPGTTGTTDGLARRGLIEHHWPPIGCTTPVYNLDGIATKRIWPLTRAGELVIELVREAGIYDEVMGA